MEIITNRQPRPLLASYELPPDILSGEFDYIGDDTGPRFFQYRGSWHDANEFTVAGASPGWHGVQPDSYFSGLLLRYCDDFERVIVGRYTT